jgi:ribose transport system ATP-binding protein
VTDQSAALHYPADSVQAPPVVDIRRLSKTFPGQRALIDVDMEVRPAEIHALLGENGSGKSTLIKVLAGIYAPDPGAVITVAGQRLPPGTPRESRRLGLQFVHQALGIVEELTAVENIALGTGYRRRGHALINWRGQREKTARLLAKLSATFDIDCPVASLRPVDRSAIAIARALDDEGGATKVLVLDEPTAALPPSEVQILFSLVRQARDAGTSVIYVSHRLDEIFELAERTTVLRDGIARGTVAITDIDRQGLVELIAGGVAPSPVPSHEAAVRPAIGQVALAVHDLTGQRLQGVSFSVRTGEVVGIAGLTGSGREELAGALVGGRPSTVRLVDSAGRQCVNPTPRKAKDFGVVLILPSRTRGAASPDLNVRENLTLPALTRYSKLGLVRRSAEVRDTVRWIQQMNIRPADPERAFAVLSGGNQQKVVFSKWLNVSPTVLVVDDPTSGVDVGARAAIYELIRSRAAQGTSFVVCSSDSEDLVAICDRVLVLGDGQIVDELTGSRIEESALLTAMLRAHSPAPETGAGMPEHVNGSVATDSAARDVTARGQAPG